MHHKSRSHKVSQDRTGNFIGYSPAGADFAKSLKIIVIFSIDDVSWQCKIGYSNQLADITKWNFSHRRCGGAARG